MDGSSEVSVANGVTFSEDNMDTNRQNEEMLAAGVEADRLDIYILCDTTGSMGPYVDSLAATINQIVKMIRLLFLPGKARIAVVSYKDYKDGRKVCTSVPLGSTPEDIMAFVQTLEAFGGGDSPWSISEATKTGLNKIAEMIRDNKNPSSDNENPSSKSLVIHYTDAPPHCTRGGMQYPNEIDERKALSGKEPGYDWVHICKYFGINDIPIYTFYTPNPFEENIQTGYITKRMLLHLGRVVLMHDTSPYMVTKATIGMIHHVLGQEFAYNDDFTMLGYKIRGKYVPHLDLTHNSDVKNERPDGGFIPYNHWGNSNDWSEKVPFSFPSIGIQLDMNEILKQFSTDKEFQDVVFQVFEELFTPDSCLCLTYNVTFGKLWRQVCKMRTDDRLQKLKTKLSDAINGLKDLAKQKQIRDWLQESYNSEEQIADLLLDKNSYEKGQNGSGPCLIIDPAKVRALLEDPTMKEDLRSLARAPSREGLKRAQDLMTSLILINNSSSQLPISPNSRDGLEVPNYLPLSLHPEILFGCLPHLVSPGMMFTTRPAIMVAIVAFLSGNQYLKKKAETFLLAKKGDWLNLSDVKNFPELLSEETIKLLHRVPQFLTDEENVVYNTLFQVHRLRLANLKSFSVKLPMSPNLSILADYRFQCVSCKHYRSFTLMTPGGRCGLCNYLVVPSDVYNPISQSRLVCCEACLCIYEVVRHQNLKVVPKCHYCRNKKKAPYVTCKECSNRYVLPDSSLLQKMEQNKDNWTCAICKNTPHLSFEFSSFLLKDILSSNLHLMTDIFNLEEATFGVIVGEENSYFEIFTNSWQTMKETPSEDKKATPVMLKSRKVFNTEELTTEIKKAVNEGDLNDTCNLCGEEKLMSQFVMSPCGRCNNIICFDCQKRWVNEIQPGKVVLHSNLVCPFCRNVLQKSVFIEYNRLAKSLLGKEHLEHVIRRMKPRLYYGWCKNCDKIKEIGPADCGDNVPYSTSDSFVCETCTFATVSVLPKCPGCKAPTIKASGCNHIYCSRCETHWCYVCGKKFDRSTIYDHLRQEHGGIGIERDNNN